MTTTKTPNYTDEMVSVMRSVYTAATTDEERASAVKTLADDLGKSVASIRAKLTREKIYQKPERLAKDGSEVITKEEFVTRITNVIPISEGDSVSLSKANKGALAAIANALEADIGD